MVWDTKFIKQELKARGTVVEKYLRQYLPPETAFPPSIHEAMIYTVFNGGKRIRPILVLEGAQLAQLDPDKAAPFACALELIHTYSLVHDDLPAMDDDDYRRGKPTCHKVYGEALAILSGDALLTLAFQLIGDPVNAEYLEGRAVLQVIHEIAEAVSSMGMIGGQVLDLEAEGQHINHAQLQKIHQLKTGCLLKAALRAGAILGGLERKKLDSLDAYADHFGLAFQITDDILDVQGEAELLGKPLGSDVQNHKCTYPSLWGIEKAQAQARESVSRCLQSLSAFGPEADFLRNLASYLLMRQN